MFSNGHDIVTQQTRICQQNIISYWLLSQESERFVSPRIRPCSTPLTTRIDLVRDVNFCRLIARFKEWRWPEVYEADAPVRTQYSAAQCSTELHSACSETSHGGT